MAINNQVLSPYQIKIDYFDVKHEITNPFVIMIGITTYDGSYNLAKLPGVDEDVKLMKDLWDKKLKYNPKIITETKHKNKIF